MCHGFRFEYSSIRSRDILRRFELFLIFWLDFRGLKFPPFLYDFPDFLFTKTVSHTNVVYAVGIVFVTRQVTFNVHTDAKIYLQLCLLIACYTISFVKVVNE